MLALFNDRNVIASCQCLMMKMLVHIVIVYAYL